MSGNSRASADRRGDETEQRHPRSMAASIWIKVCALLGAYLLLDMILAGLGAG